MKRILILVILLVWDQPERAVGSHLLGKESDEGVVTTSNTGGWGWWTACHSATSAVALACVTSLLVVACWKCKQHKTTRNDVDHRPQDFFAEEEKMKEDEHILEGRLAEIGKRCQQEVQQKEEEFERRRMQVEDDQERLRQQNCLLRDEVEQLQKRLAVDLSNEETLKKESDCAREETCQFQLSERQEITKCEIAKGSDSEEGTDLSKGKRWKNIRKTMKERGKNQDRGKRTEEEAEEIIRLLMQNLEDLRVAKLSTYDDRFHLMGHVGKLRKEERLSEMEQVIICCLPNLEEGWKKNQKEKKKNQKAEEKANMDRRLNFPWSDPFLKSTARPQSVTSSHEKVPRLKFDTLNWWQKMNLKQRMKLVLISHDPFQVLQCPPWATKYDVQLLYKDFIKEWIAQYGSFHFRRRKGYEDAANVLTRVSCAYTMLVTSLREKREIGNLQREMPIFSWPEAWGIVMKKRRGREPGHSAGEERMENLLGNEHFNLMLFHQKDPAVRKALVSWMYYVKIRKPIAATSEDVGAQGESTALQ